MSTCEVNDININDYMDNYSNNMSSNITSIDLSNNHITENGMKIFAENL